MTRHCAASALVLAAWVGTSTALGADFQFIGTLTNGYSVQGVLRTKAGAPSSFVESNPDFPNAPFATQFLESASLSVFLAGSEIASGTPVVGGISYEAYLYTAFDSSTLMLSGLDLQARNPGAGSEPYHFISNGVAPDGTSVAYGTTTFNLFLFDPSNSNYTYLGSTSTLVVTAIPEPAGLLAFAIAPVLRRRRR